MQTPEGTKKRLEKSRQEVIGDGKVQPQQMFSFPLHSGHKSGTEVVPLRSCLCLRHHLFGLLTLFPVFCQASNDIFQHLTFR